MPRESKARRRERAVEMCRRMDERYPEAECALHYGTPFELVIAVLLSAQTTDAAVNKVTPELFDRWPNPAEMAAANQADVAEVIRSIGFWRTKSAHCVECAQKIMADYAGEVPRTMDELKTLPGVGRKTANIVLNNAFGIVEGIAVDTHVFRIATRMGLTRADTPLKAEQDLLDVIPRELWGPVNHQLVLFGREVCDARRPLCGECPLADICPSAGKPPESTRRKAAARRG
ncbi:MAG: endonuclease III [Atopobiaceae bacterium]|jgi:endonuclease-3|nr:endonuclease III [Atopobiaceae bacterium]